MQISSDSVLNASEAEVQQIMDDIRLWYRIHYPDWDVLYFACPTHERQQQIDMLKTLLLTEH